MYDEYLDITSNCIAILNTHTHPDVFCTDMSQYSGLQSKQWYWKDEMAEEWRVYSDVDQMIINKAFMYRQKECYVAHGKYRLKFADNDGPIHYQFQNNKDNETSKQMVIYVKPDDIL